jgi:hypothetical protein
MDLYDAKFRQNGGCGYVLKPSVMREQISFFSANSREIIPGLPPQFLHLKVRILVKLLMSTHTILCVNENSMTYECWPTKIPNCIAFSF